MEGILTIETILGVLPCHSRVVLYLDGEYTCNFWSDNRRMRRFISAIKADVMRIECMSDYSDFEEDAGTYYRIDASTYDDISFE